jgi:coproporphyrinogen III oxidase-like Fe-S oxidoreductase
LPFEFMLNALRLTGGFPLELFRKRTGLPVAALEPALSRAEEQGYIERDWQRVRPTERGQRFLNEVVGLFLP